MGAAPSTTCSPGVITMPPPTPNRPDSTPETRPIRMPSTTSRAVTVARGSPEQLGCPPEHLALPLVRGSLQGALEREPSHLFHLVVAIGGVAAGAPHQEEVHGLADAGVFPHVEVARVAEGGLD